MGLIETPAAGGQLVLTPHPVTLEGQRHVRMDLQPGERLCSFLHRHVLDIDQGDWIVSIGGRVVPRALWAHTFPKDGQVIEVRGAVGENALYIVALAALTYFTFGFGAATAGAWGAGAVAGAYGGLVASAVFMVGSALINKALGPKVEKPGEAKTGTVYSLGAARNRQRLYEPLGLLFGRVRIAPDVASAPYGYYEGDDQYLVMSVTPGIGVGRVEAYYNGDTLLSSYEDVSIFHRSYAAMPDDTLPGYSNADTIDGGELLDTSSDPKGQPGQWVQRTTSPDTVRVLINIDALIFDLTSKGKPKNNTETVQVQYCPTGTSAWSTLASRSITNSTQAPRRMSITADVPKGQYDLRVRTAGQNTNGSGATAKFTWSTLTSVQEDTATYAGIARTVIVMKATGQLNGAPDELRAVHVAAAIPVWRNGAWVTEETSNPGAHILKYARGYFDVDGVLIAGMGKPDEEIDIEALQGFMAHCEASGYTYDYWLQDERSHQEVLEAIALAGMGQVSWATGRLSVAWVGADQPLSGVVNMAVMKKGSFSVDYTLANAADGVEYTYYDKTTWDTKTLRVTAPGITTMLNPARLTGEGVTSEAQAAELARYHLAQSLYQYKDIAYDTDLEYLTYRRLSRLAVSHDLTQWGYGGRVMVAARNGNTVTLTLDDVVPPRPSGSSFIGLRVPGETVYRVFAVQPFAAETDTIALVDAWPADAALPGEGYQDGPDWQPNPPADTLWIYDFKSTPGYGVRVVNVEPHSDLKGATIAVVPEGPEFWAYVKTGQYIPPANGSLLATRPIASALTVTEEQVITGDVIATDLVATFEITGPFDHAVVYATAADGNGELGEVAQTSTRTARWRIPSAGTYTVNVRPFAPDGLMGVGASLVYTTAGADAPPVNFDIFTVEEISGGIRRYNWGYFNATIQSANLAGAEIRYAEAPAQGQASPGWDAMTPVGDSGYHTGAFDSPVPSAGAWVFAIRARNTNGTLSASAKYITVNLGKNTGELVEDLQDADAAVQAAITQEIIDRFNADAAEADARAAAILQEAEQRVAAIQAAADVLQAQINDVFDADEWADDKTYPLSDVVKSNGKLYRSKQADNLDHAVTDEAWWELIGNYSGLADAVGGISQQAQINANNIATVDGKTTANSQSITGLTTRMGNAESGINANASALSGLQTTVTQQGNTLTTQGQSITSIQNALPGKADATALSALENRVTSTEGNVSSQGSAITALNNTVNVLGSSNPNLLPNGGFEYGTSKWNQTGGLVADTNGVWGSKLYGQPTAQNSDCYSDAIVISPGDYTFSGDAVLNATSTSAYLQFDLLFYDSAGNSVGSTIGVAKAASFSFANDGSVRNALKTTGTAPSNATQCRVRMKWAPGSGTITGVGFRQLKLERGNKATPYSSEGNAVYTASAVNSLSTSVSTINGTLTTQSNAITAVKSAMPGGGNLLPNPTAENDVTGWSLVVNSWNSTLTRNLAAPDWVPDGGTNFGFNGAGAVTGSVVARSTKFGIDSNLYYQASVYTGAHRCQAHMSLRFYDANGNDIDEAYAVEPNNAQSSGGKSLSNWKRLYNVPRKPPSNATSAVLQLFGAAISGQSDPYVFFTQAMVEAVSADKITPSYWSPSNQGLDSKYATATQSLQTQITTQGTNLATAITNVSVRVASSPNLLPNGGFENGTAKWNQLNYLSAVDSGGWGRILLCGTPANGNSDTYSDAFPVDAGSTYTFSGDAVLQATSAAANLTFDLIFYDSSGNVTNVGFGPARAAPFNFDLTDAARTTYKVTATASSGTTQCRVRMRWVSNGATITTLGFRQMKVELGYTATRYSADNLITSTASATQSLTTSVNSLTGVVNAKYTLALSVNGYVSGITSINNGTTSTFDVVADTFRIVAPNGGARFEYSANNARIYDSNGVLRVRLGVW